MTKSKRASSRRRLEAHAEEIADALDACGIHAVPGDCADGIVCVVLFHHGEPDADARATMQVDDEDGGERWEEKLLYEGRQIDLAVERAAGIDPATDDRVTALAVMRTAQDVDTCL